MELKPLGQGVGHVKVGLYGKAGSGKTHTSILFACGIRKHFGLEGPIGFFDTETGSEYVASMAKEATGLDPVGFKSRALSDATEFLRECEKVGVAVAIIDSVSHLWKEIMDSYLKQTNEARVKAGRNPLTKLSFADWGPIKQRWGVFTDLYLNSKLHIIICGRAGAIWEYEDVEDTGKKELIQTGTKMKAEGEFAYEPSLLAELERVQDGKKVCRRMTVIKDRFRVLDGKEFDNPTFESIAPHVRMLKSGASNTVDTARQTPMNVDESGDAEWQREKRNRIIFSEEIQGLITVHFPGQSALDKKAKAEVIFRALGTRSWEAVTNMPSDKLKAGLAALPQVIEEYAKSATLTADPGFIEAAKAAVEPLDVKKGKKVSQ